ncbi:hypothetical protein I302_105073 [Kwoniella bestiolae CBS 10118]|uniref:Uncharacterized protein n=1 Tax=Kwoniella bestiolae CBS 10118 TaxID=1296100 RepID=A0AAJ8K899_9TREE
MDQFLIALRSFPQDISSLDIPDLSNINLDDFNENLFNIIQETDSASARHSILQVAALLPPQPKWSDITLQWATEQDSTSATTDPIVKYAGSALAQDIFPSDRWLEALEDDSHPHVSLKRILVTWSGLKFDVSQHGCWNSY